MSVRPRLLTLAAWFAASRLVIAALGVVGVATFATLAGGGAGSADQGVVVHDTPAVLNPELVWHKWDSIWYRADRTARLRLGTRHATGARPRRATFRSIR